MRSRQKLNLGNLSVPNFRVNSILITFTAHFGSKCGIYGVFLEALGISKNST